MNRPTLSDFCATLEWSDDPERDFPGNGYGDACKGAGWLFLNGSLLIEQQVPAMRGCPAVFHVELFGDDFSGSLADCEAEFWHAALNDGVFADQEEALCAG